MKRLEIGIIGCGSIGTQIALACQGILKEKVLLIAVCDAEEERARALNARIKKKAAILKLDELIKKTEFVVEAASASISAGVVKRCVRGKKDCMIMSVGGLLGEEGLLRSALKAGIRVYIPSGALCGVDGLKAASVGKIGSVTLTTRKPPNALAGAPYIKEKGIDLTGINTETVIFEGSAMEAVKAFPQNINVSAVLSLAGIGAGNTRVKIVTSPGYTANIHELEIAGEFGRIMTRTENVPSPENPKTSRLAVMSAIATIDGITSGVRIGT